MYIFWHGLSCVRMQGQDKDAVVVLNPFSQDAGMKSTKLTGDVVISSAPDVTFGAADTVKPRGEDKVILIDTPGEYEAKSAFVYGIQARQDPHETTALYSVELDGVTVGVLGSLKRSLNEAELDLLGRIDILMLPVGAHSVMGTRVAIEVIGQLEPRIVIPIHYALPECSIELDPVETFLKEYGIKEPERLDKLKITKKDLPAEETKVIVLGVQ